MTTFRQLHTASVLALMLAACKDESSGIDAGVRRDDAGRAICMYADTTFHEGDTWPGGPCSTCTCTPRGAECEGPMCIDAAVDAAADATSPTCEASGNCASGPECGAQCCGQGERCVNGTCMCGAGPACTGGDHCDSAGPVIDSCASFCCGASGPCPN
jgi:hypothetical protein